MQDFSKNNLVAHSVRALLSGVCRVQRRRFEYRPLPNALCKYRLPYTLSVNSLFLSMDPTHVGEISKDDSFLLFCI